MDKVSEMAEGFDIQKLESLYVVHRLVGLAVANAEGRWYVKGAKFTQAAVLVAGLDYAPDSDLVKALRFLNEAFVYVVGRGHHAVTAIAGQDVLEIVGRRIVELRALQGGGSKPSVATTSHTGGEDEL